MHFMTDTVPYELPDHSKTSTLAMRLHGMPDIPQTFAHYCFLYTFIQRSFRHVQKSLHLRRDFAYAKRIA